LGSAGGLLFDKMIEVAPKAMLQIQWAQVKILFFLVKFFNFIFKLFELIQLSTFSNLRPTQQFVLSNAVRMFTTSSRPIVTRCSRPMVTTSGRPDFTSENDQRWVRVAVSKS